VTAYGNRPITDPALAHRFRFHYQPTPDGGATVFHDEMGEPDMFYRNEGRGRFVAVPVGAGVFMDATGVPLRESHYDWGLSAMFRDLNGDGEPDPVCKGLDLPAASLDEAPALVLNNSSGFGGSNVCHVLSRPRRAIS
jgi:hypothetical protein